MKIRILPNSIAIAFAAVLMSGTHVQAQSLNDLIRVEAQAKLSQDRRPQKAKPGAPSKQFVTLQISLRGKPKVTETRTGTWTIFGRDLEDRVITKIESGNFKVELSASGQQQFETTEAATTSTPAYYEITGGQDNRKSKRIEATGVKYVGYSVVIKDGDTVVGELYSEPSFKQKTK